MRHLKWAFVFFVITTSLALTTFNFILLRFMLHSSNPFWLSFKMTFLNTPSLQTLILLLCTLFLLRFAWVALFINIGGLTSEIDFIVKHGFSFGGWGPLNWLNYYYQIAFPLIFAVGAIYFGILGYRKLKGQPPKQ